MSTENMAESTKNIAAKRTLAKSKFTRISNSLKNGMDENLSEKTIRSRFEALQAAWKDVQSRHDDYMECVADDTNVKEHDKWIESISTEYFAVEGKVDKYLENLEQSKLTVKEAKRQQELKEERQRHAEQEAARKTDELRCENEKRAKESQELFLHREQEYTTFTNVLKSIKTLIDHKEQNELSHISVAVRDAKCKMDSAVSACNLAQKRYISSLPHEEALAETGWLNDILASYNDLSSKAHIFMSKFSKDKSADTAKPKEVKQSGIKLEKVRFRQFSGDIRQYPKFKAEFKKHLQPLCNSNEIAFVLRSHLSDSIYYDIENLGDDIDKIWERLDRKYGDKGKLVDSIMSDIRNMNKCIDGEESHILKFINIVEKADIDL